MARLPYDTPELACDIEKEKNEAVSIWKSVPLHHQMISLESVFALITIKHVVRAMIEDTDMHLESQKHQKYLEWLMKRNQMLHELLYKMENHTDTLADLRACLVSESLGHIERAFLEPYIQKACDLHT